ncbi:peptidylprolyl isomerase [uncultured Cocleimonas sp.]|uniref:peptidylprolyl isomerase n=1 Tax=uncultured Cocleimonas sp. TaxID=1051587 RepID=UPI00261CBD67|nr:peptidylprolyl isomerase [uncultured Cocleimonas sp.]
MKKMIRPMLLAFNCSFFFLILSGSSFAEDLTNKDKSILLKDGGIVITTEDAQLMLDDMNPAQKHSMLNNEEKFKNLLSDALVLKKRAKVALDKGIDKKRLVQWKLKKQQQHLLVNELIDDYKNNIKTPENLEQLAKETYDSSPEAFKIEEEVKVAHILFIVKKDDTEERKQEQLSKAESVLQSIKQGFAFNDAVKVHSEDTGSVPNDGVIDFFTRGKMVPAFEKAAFALEEKDNLSDIVESQFGFHIIKFLDRKEESIKPFEDVKEKLIKIEKDKFVKSKTKHYIESIYIDSSTNIYIPAIKSFFNEARKELPKSNIDLLTK